MMSKPEYNKDAVTLPYQAEYDEVNRAVADIQQAAELNLYGPFESGMLRQICQPNPLFAPGADCFNRVGELVSGRSLPDEVELFDLGVDVGADIQAGTTSPRNLVLGYLNACLSMDIVKSAFVGTKSTTRLLNAVQTYTRRQLLDSLPLDSKTENLLDTIKKGLAAVYETDQVHDDIFGWLVTKMQMLVNDYRSLKVAYQKLSSLYEGIAEDMSPGQLNEIDEKVRLLNHSSMRNRKYGTKSAYTEASIGGSWIFYDGDDYRQTVLEGSKNLVLPRFAAIVHHSPLKDLTDIRLTNETLPFGQFAEVKRISGGMGATQPDFQIVIGMDGRMSLDYEGTQGVEWLLRNKPVVARMLVAEIASVFYDLSMPIDTTTKPQSNYATMNPVERQQFNPVLQLLIPRLRRLHDPDTSREPTGRVVREHDVNWFVRLLPPGWHASPDAIENAARIGVVLAPNETFVREHKRGTNHAVLGHHAFKRVTDLRAGRDY